MLNARFITKVTGMTLQRGTEAAHVKLPLAPTATAAAPYIGSNYLKWISGLKYSGNSGKTKNTSMKILGTKLFSGAVGATTADGN